MKQKLIFNSIRLLVNARKEPYLLYRNLLGFYPLDISLYELAMLSRSSQTRDAHGRSINNERLEFLGDALLEVVVTDVLYHRYPNENEGFLTILRSRIVQRKSLNRLGIKIGLNHFAKSMGHSHSDVYGNALEALIGAIYLDRGFRYVQKFVIEKLLEPHIDMDRLAHEGANAKVSLHEWCQKNKYTIRFEIEKDPIHLQCFVAQVYINDIFFGKGISTNKKGAQFNASSDAYNKIKSNDPIILQLEDSQNLDKKAE